MFSSSALRFIQPLVQEIIKSRREKIPARCFPGNCLHFTHTAHSEGTCPHSLHRHTHTLQAALLASTFVRFPWRPLQVAPQPGAGAALGPEQARLCVRGTKTPRLTAKISILKPQINSEEPAAACNNTFSLAEEDFSGCAEDQRDGGGSR